MALPHEADYICRMRREELIQQLQALRPKLEGEGVEHIAIFGSRARGDHQRDSDLDILVEVASDARFSLLNLIGVEHIIGDEIGLKANAVMRRSLDERFRKAITPDIVEVF